MIKLASPQYTHNELKYVEDVLQSSRWAYGKYAELLEKEIRKLTGCKYAVAMNSGTSALHIALLINGIGKGDKVLVPTLTFIAPVNAIRYVGAEPVFIDCDEYGNIDIDKIEDMIDDDVKAILPVHLFGGGCDMHSILEIATLNKLKVIEDSAESLGAFYKGSGFKFCTGNIGDCGIYSFNANKIVSGGSGGMLVTNDRALFERALYLASQAKSEGYIHNEVGYNYLMSDITAAVTFSQVEEIKQIIAIRKTFNKTYNSSLKMLQYPDYIEPNYWLNNLVCDNPDRVQAELKKHDIQSRRLWGLCHIQKPYDKCVHGQIIQAPAIYNTTLSLPSGNDLTISDIIKVIEIVEGVI